MRYSLLLTVLSMLASAAVCAKVAARLMRPLENLVSIAENLSVGDFSRRAEVRRNDEIGRVARAVNIMAERLQLLVSSLEESVRERTAELEERNRELDQSRGRLELILDSTAEGIYGIDREGNCTFANASCLKLLGYGSQDELIGRNMHFMIHYAHGDGSSCFSRSAKFPAHCGPDGHTGGRRGFLDIRRDAPRCGLLLVPQVQERGTHRRGHHLHR